MTSETKVCSVMQPTYLPWAGYFNLIAQSDIFIFYDSANFSKGSWQSRNRILVQGEIQWISLPILHVKNQQIKNTQLHKKINWPRKHINQLLNSYSKHPFISELTPMLNLLETNRFSTLADLNIEIITWFANQLGVNTPFYRTSELDIPLKATRSQKLESICDQFNCGVYLSPVGAEQYLTEDKAFTNTNSVLKYQNFVPNRYSHHKQDRYTPYLSIFDVVANIGFKATSNYIK